MRQGFANPKIRNYDIFIKCVKSIKRWPSQNALILPSLPEKCSFVFCSPTNRQYKLNINGVIYLHSDYAKIKKEIKG